MAKTGSKNKVKEIEERLTYLCENDINNPDIYNLLKQLARIYIFQNKYTGGYFGIEDVCHDVATDTYMRVLKGRTKITHWMYYIGRSIKLSYVSHQRQLEHEYIDTGHDKELRTAIIQMCAGASLSIEEEFDTMQNGLFLTNIDYLVREALNHSKFKLDSKAWLTLYTNVCLSLYYDKITYFRISDDLKPYVSLLVHQFRELLITSEFTEKVFNDTSDDLPMLLFYDELDVMNKDRKRDV